MRPQSFWWTKDSIEEPEGKRQRAPAVCSAGGLDCLRFFGLTINLDR